MRSMKQNKIKHMLIAIFVLLCIPVLLGVKWTKIDGTSMEPTIHNGAIVIQMDSWRIKAGDVVLFLTPEWKNWPKNERIWCKRIDHVKGNEFWLLGDNDKDSCDSRSFGYVNRTNIYKKVLFIIQ